MDCFPQRTDRFSIRYDGSDFLVQRVDACCVDFDPADFLVQRLDACCIFFDSERDFHVVSLKSDNKASIGPFNIG